MPEPVHDIAQVHFVWLRSYLSDNLPPYSHILLDMAGSPGCCSHSIYSDQGIVTASCCKSCAGPCLFPLFFVVVCPGRRERVWLEPFEGVTRREVWSIARHSCKVACWQSFHKMRGCVWIMKATAPESSTSYWYSYRDLVLVTFQGDCSYRRLDWSFGEMPIYGHVSGWVKCA